MQPYFLPYIGYWQLLSACDHFVLYDSIQYTKKGWINRNRFLLNGRPEIFTLPLRKASHGLNVVDREIAPEFRPDKLLARWSSAYQCAPYFKSTYSLMEQVIRYPDRNLFDYIFVSIKSIASHLGISTPITISSELESNVSIARGSDRVLRLCKTLAATHYINSIGGTDIYDKQEFLSAGLTLHFLRTHKLEYSQQADKHVPFLSILDVLMYNSIDKVRNKILFEYDLL
ncbi:MAG: WbqC family protein [Cyanobacteriota bacterium]